MSREQFEQELPRAAADHEVAGDHEGDLTVDRNTRIRGIVNGDLRVRSGAQAVVSGIVRGALTIEPDATAYLAGVVEGDLHVDGGILLIGVVRGAVTGSEGSSIATGGRQWMT